MTDMWERERQERERRTAWLASLKAGDEIAICHTGGIYGARYEFATVEKRTPTQIVAGDRYRAKNGDQMGNRWGAHLVEPTPELKQEVADTKEKQELVRQLDSVKWRNLELPTLRAVAAIIEPNAVSKETK